MDFIVKLASENRIDKSIPSVLNKEKISYVYGFTPEQIKKMDFKDYLAYSMISAQRFGEKGVK